MSSVRPFSPLADTITVTVGLASAAQALTGAPTGRSDVRLYNAGTVPVFIKFGASDVTVTTGNGVPIPAGAVEVLNAGNATHVATISGTAAQTLYVTSGDGN